MPKYKPQYRNCCFCFSLRTGSIILTLLWMGASFALAAIFLHSIMDQDSEDPLALYVYLQDTTFILACGTILTIFVSFYGLYALIVEKTDRSIRIYSNLAWLVMVGLWTLFSLIMIITLAINGGKFPYPDLQKNMIKLIGLILGTCSINIYFAIILRVYLARRHQDITSHEESHNHRDSLASTIAKWVESRNNSLRSDFSRNDSMRADIGENLNSRVFGNLHQPILQETPPTAKRISKIRRRIENDQDETDASENVEEIIENSSSDVTTSTAMTRNSASLEHTEIQVDLNTPISSNNLTEYRLYL